MPHRGTQPPRRPAGRLRLGAVVAVALVAVALVVVALGVALFTNWREYLEAPARRSRRAEGIPTRPASAVGGSEFARRTARYSSAERQQAAVAELRRGNLPEFLRVLRPVQLHYQPLAGRPISAVVWVMPDYLAIGSDQDFVRIPLNLPSAGLVASELGYCLPTDKIVDAIYEQAVVRLDPLPLPAGSQMRSTRYYVLHQQMIEQQRGRSPGALVAGHKKDVVLTGRLREKPGRLAIYGWHRRDGEPIQPLSTLHGARYADYSHGVRLVATSVLVNGKRYSIYDVLETEALAPVLSYEGVIRAPHELLAPQGALPSAP